jgi:two-component system, LytTR family, response regulator
MTIGKSSSSMPTKQVIFDAMQKIKAIIVDDERRARAVLENLLLRFCPEVELVAQCSNVLEAVEAIKTHHPDLVLLDIEMPNYAGFELVNFFKEVDFEIIFVTAYDQYALKAFDLAAIDYLLKPVDIERLKQAIGRVRLQCDMKERVQRMALLSQTLEKQQIKNLIVNDKGQQHLIALDTLIAIEAQAAYCTLHTEDRQFIASKNLKHFENILEGSDGFLRVHKSWLINQKHILNYSKSEMLIQLKGGIVAKLSKYQKTDFEAAIRS